MISQNHLTRLIAGFVALVVVIANLIHLGAGPGVLPPPPPTHPLVAIEAEQARLLVREFSRAIDSNSRREIRIAIFEDESSCDPSEDLQRIIASESSWIVTLIDSDQIREGELIRHDLVIIPGGRGSQQLASLGESGRRSVQDFIRSGGGYVGICAGGFLASTRYLSLVNAEVQSGDVEIPELGRRSLAVRGPAVIATELTDEGCQVFGHWESPIHLDFAGGPVFVDGGRLDLPRCVVLARYRTEVSDIEAQRGTMIGTPSIIGARLDRGRVMAFGPHPERTKGMELLVKRAILAVARDQEQLIENVSSYSDRIEDQ